MEHYPNASNSESVKAARTALKNEAAANILEARGCIYDNGLWYEPIKSGQKPKGPKIEKGSIDLSKTENMREAIHDALGGTMEDLDAKAAKARKDTEDHLGKLSEKIDGAHERAGDSELVFGDKEPEKTETDVLKHVRDDEETE